MDAIGMKARIPAVAAMVLALCLLLMLPAQAQESLPVRAEIEITMPAGQAETVIYGIASLADRYGFAVKVVPAAPASPAIQMYLYNMTVMGTVDAAGDPSKLHLSMYDGPFPAAEPMMEDWIRALGAYVNVRDGLGLRVVQAPAVDGGPSGKRFQPPLWVIDVTLDDQRVDTVVDAVAAFGQETGLAVHRTPPPAGGTMIVMYALDMSVVGSFMGASGEPDIGIVVYEGATPASPDALTLWVERLGARLEQIPGVHVRIDDRT